MGVLLALSGEYAEALSSYRGALTLYNQSLVDSPQDINHRYRVIITRAGVAEMQAKLGKRDAALAESSKVIAMLDETNEDSANGPQRSLRGQVYLRVAETYKALAGTHGATPSEQREQWRAARAMYVRSLQIWQDMQKRGILTGEDATKPEELARAIAQCDASLRQLA